ncbi:ADP-ribosylation factor-binding protein GGA3 [Panulirus ornatus]|uniref:ADP-ribosylation factor-binding protein GGA3 n=1 Tax=Panulirus ornatus TaxID=150431 RepID=UPI003A8B02AA
MAAAVPTLEVLIQKATSPLNPEDDPNSIQAVCHAVTAEPGGVQTAVRLLAHKIQSPQEREALQALSVSLLTLSLLRYCAVFISMKLMKKFENFSCDPIILQDDPQYIGAPTAPEPRSRTNAVFEDEEKSRLLQRLLQSKNPEDLHKANALIKSMVKEDERRMERTSRRIVEVETAMNNVRVLDEMLSRHQESPATQADLDLMLELHSSCSTLRSNLYRLVSEMDDKEEGIGDLLKANDELSRVMGRYKLIIEGTKVENQVTALESQHKEGTLTSQHNGVFGAQKDGEILLDLSTPEDLPNSQGIADLVNKDLQDIALDGLNVGRTNSSSTDALGTESNSSLLDGLDGILNVSAISTGVPGLQLGPPIHAAMTPVLVPQTASGTSNGSIQPDAQSRERADPLDDLTALGTSLIKQNLPANVPALVQFKPAEKLSMNQMKQQQQSVNQVVTSSGTPSNLLPKTTPSGRLTTPQLSPSVSPGTVVGSSGTSGDSVDSLLNMDLLSGDVSVDVISDETRNTESTVEKVNLIDDSSLIGSHDDSLLEAPSPSSKPDIANNTTQCQDDKKSVNEDTKRRLSSSSNAQFMEVKPMVDLKVTLESIKPGRQGSVTVLDSNDVTVTLHFTENQPRDDVSVVVVSTVSHNSQPISNYVLQAVVPKGCKVRLQPPSSNDLAAYSPFLPPPAITQIMLIANPNKLNVSLKVMLSYSLDDDPVTEMGEVESLPL